LSVHGRACCARAAPGTSGDAVECAKRIGALGVSSRLMADLRRAPVDRHPLGPGPARRAFTASRLYIQ
jgi:hypothetical protein